MDWQLRIALIIAGCALVGYIYYDYAKKKKIQKENEKLKKQFGSISESVDSSGFDHVGVGTPRPASSLEDEGVPDPTKKSQHSTSQVKGTTVEEFIEHSLEKETANDEGNITEDTFIENNESEDKISNDTFRNNNIANNNPSTVAQEFEQEQTLEESKQEKSEAPEKALVLSLILQAPQGNHFKGRDFLPLFLSQGLRHGEMGIFHRRTRAGKEPGPVLFSLANGIAPGTFDINNMENFQTPALACFVTLPGPEDAQVAYNAMYKTCLLLQQELGGELLDETKSVYSKQTHNHRLDQIKDYSFKFGA